MRAEVLLAFQTGERPGRGIEPLPERGQTTRHRVGVFEQVVVSTGRVQSSLWVKNACRSPSSRREARERAPAGGAENATPESVPAVRRAVEVHRGRRAAASQRKCVRYAGWVAASRARGRNVCLARRERHAVTGATSCALPSQQLHDFLPRMPLVEPDLPVHERQQPVSRARTGQPAIKASGTDGRGPSLPARPTNAGAGESLTCYQRAVIRCGPGDGDRSSPPGSSTLAANA